MHSFRVRIRLYLAVAVYMDIKKMMKLVKIKKFQLEE